MPYSSNSGKAFIDKSFAKLKRFEPDFFQNSTTLNLGDKIDHLSKESARTIIDQCLQNTDLLIVQTIQPLQEALDFLGPNVISFSQDDDISSFIMSFTKHDLVKKALDVKVAVYSICKNEGAFIQRYFDALEAFDVDQLVICDTGSTDGTWNIVAQNTAPFINRTAKQIHVSPWRFDDARNTALSLVWPEIDMCISLDIDEYLSDNFINELKALMRKNPQTTRVNHRFSSFWNEEETAFSDHWHERIHARAGYRWILPVHEKLETHGQEFTEWLGQVRMYQKPDLQKSRSSYRVLLEQSVAERPQIWKSWSFLASEYAASSEFEQAIYATKQALNISDSDKAFLNMQLGFYHENLGRYPEAQEYFATATFYAPTVREYKVHLANYLERRGEQSKANFYLVQASHITTRTYGYEFDPLMWNEDFNQRVEKAKAAQ